jgi:hypothetical protein
MRPMLAVALLAYGLIGMVDAVFASIYVPGHIRDGIYVRPHFVSAPKLDYRAWPDEGPIIEPKTEPQQPPVLDLAPPPDPATVGEES